MSEINSPRANESRVEAINVIGRHEDQSLFARDSSIQNVQKTTESHFAAPSAVGRGRTAQTVLAVICWVNRSIREGNIDIFKEDDALREEMVRRVTNGWKRDHGGNRAQSHSKAIIRQSSFREIEDTDVVSEAACKRHNETRLAGAWGAVEKIASSVWNPSV